MWTLARVKRTFDSKLRTKIIHNNNTGGKTEGVICRGVMSLKFWISTKRKKMELSTLVAQRASKKGQYKNASANIETGDGNNVRIESDMQDWWKRPTSSKKYAKRLIPVNNNVNVCKKGQKGKRSEIKDWWERSFLSKKKFEKKESQRFVRCVLP